MSQFMLPQSSFTGMQTKNDLRHLARRFMATPDRPQLSEALDDFFDRWPRPRFMGGEMSMGILAMDAGSSGAYEPATQTFGSPSMKRLTGTTRNSAGDPLANAIVAIYLTTGDVWLRDCTSDLAGYYEAFSEYSGQNHYLLAYKAGAPDVAGTTVTTLVPT